MNGMRPVLVGLVFASLLIACADKDGDEVETTGAQTMATDTSATTDATGGSTSSMVVATSSSGEVETASGPDTSGESRGSSGGGRTTGGGGASGCFPDGIYGRCSESPDCQCLQGAAVYQVCTTNCQSDDECGDVADFDGAEPGCFPINPGAAENICVLLCTDTTQCPCGLICTDSGVPNVSICAELQ